MALGEWQNGAYVDYENSWGKQTWTNVKDGVGVGLPHSKDNFDIYTAKDRRSVGVSHFTGTSSKVSSYETRWGLTKEWSVTIGETRYEYLQAMVDIFTQVVAQHFARRLCYPKNAAARR